MLKFDATASMQKKMNLKTDNYEFYVYSSKGQEFRRKHEGLDYFFSISAFEKNTKINKDGNYSIDINLKQIFDYLLRKLIENNDIVPGIEVTTEMWDGIGEMKIQELKYELLRNEKTIFVHFFSFDNFSINNLNVGKSTCSRLYR